MSTVGAATCVLVAYLVLTNEAATDATFVAAEVITPCSTVGIRLVDIDFAIVSWGEQLSPEWENAE